MRYVASELFGGELYRYTHGFNMPALLAWASGIALYRFAMHAGWTCGASLPSMAGAGLIYFLFRILSKQGCCPEAEGVTE